MFQILLQPEFVDLFGPNLLPVLLVLAGLIVSIMEALAPGANFIVVGVALLAAGLLGLALGPVAGPFVLGLAVLVFGAIALYIYRDLGMYEANEQSQTSDSSDLKGQFGTVTERVSTSDGEVKVEDGGFNPYFSARAMDGEIAEGTEVMVVDPGGGNVLTVAPVQGDDPIDRELARGRADRVTDASEASEPDSSDVGAGTEPDAGESTETDAMGSTETDAMGSTETDEDDSEREPERN